MYTRRRGPGFLPSGAGDAVFPEPYGNYFRALHRYHRAGTDAKIPRATIHDLRHPFAVHCAQAGVPLPRLQKLLGHSRPLMTMRYMKHAPEAHFAEDAARARLGIMIRSNDADLRNPKQGTTLQRSIPE